jgi:hypothetical protein
VCRDGLARTRSESDSSGRPDGEDESDWADLHTEIARLLRDGLHNDAVPEQSADEVFDILAELASNPDPSVEGEQRHQATGEAWPLDLNTARGALMAGGGHGTVRGLESDVYPLDGTITPLTVDTRRLRTGCASSTCSATSPTVPPAAVVQEFVDGELHQWLRPAPFYAEQGIDLRLGERVTSIDRDRRRVSASIPCEYGRHGVRPVSSVRVTSGGRARDLSPDRPMVKPCVGGASFSVSPADRGRGRTMIHRATWSPLAR